MLSNTEYLGFKDVLIKPAASDIESRKDVNLLREFQFRGGITREFLPVVASNMVGVGTFKVARVLGKYKMITCIGKKASLWDYQTCYKAFPEVFPYVAVTVGLKEAAMIDKLDYNRIPVDLVCVDVANGYIDKFVEYVTYIKSRFPNKIVIAGNVATWDGADRLWRAGADIVKLGIGSGSVCTTRYKTGVGVPQISAIHEVTEIIGINDGYLMSDGGCTGPGDIAKAVVAGADFVMIGGMLAGTVETGAVFHGSAYTPAGERTSMYKTSEGKMIHSLKADLLLEDRVLDILGGLRSTGSYIGKRDIKDWYQAELIRVREQTNDIYGRPS